MAAVYVGFGRAIEDVEIDLNHLLVSLALRGRTLQEVVNSGPVTELISAPAGRYQRLRAGVVLGGSFGEELEQCARELGYVRLYGTLVGAHEYTNSAIDREALFEKHPHAGVVLATDSASALHGFSRHDRIGNVYASAVAAEHPATTASTTLVIKEERASHHPVVLVVDDAHHFDVWPSEGTMPYWAGPETISFELAHTLLSIANVGRQTFMLEPFAGTGVCVASALARGASALAADVFEVRGLRDQFAFLAGTPEQRHGVLAEARRRIGEAAWYDAALEVASDSVCYGASHPLPQIQYGIGTEAFRRAGLTIGDGNLTLELLSERLAFYAVRRAVFEAGPTGASVTRELVYASVEAADGFRRIDLPDDWSERVHCVLADVRSIVMEESVIDAIVCDPPYGAALSIPEGELVSIYRSFVELALRASRDRARVVFPILSSHAGGHCTSEAVSAEAVCAMVTDLSRSLGVSVRPLPGYREFSLGCWRSRVVERTILGFEVVRSPGSPLQPARSPRTIQMKCPRCRGGRGDDRERWCTDHGRFGFTATGVERLSREQVRTAAVQTELLLDRPK